MGEGMADAQPLCFGDQTLGWDFLKKLFAWRFVNVISCITGSKGTELAITS